MSQLDPTDTLPIDIVTAALVECGAIGIGQSALQSDLDDGSARLYWMLQEWQAQRWMVYHMVTLEVQCSPTKIYYTVGPGGDFDTGSGSVRPTDVTSCQLRQYVSGGPVPGPPGPGPGPLPTNYGIGYYIIGESVIGPVAGSAAVEGGIYIPSLTNPASLYSNPIDYDMTVVKSKEDYNRITLKGLGSQSLCAYYDPDYPLGALYPWPVPKLTSYALLLTFPTNLPPMWAQSNETINLPYQYYACMYLNLAIRLRAKYRIGTFPGDSLPAMAKNSLQTLRSANAQIPSLRMPGGLGRMTGAGTYNIFGDMGY
jgi:hypothetical protein